MSSAVICDRCGNPVIDLGGVGIRARKPKLYGIIPGERAASNIWGEWRDKIDLCAECTKEFFKFSKGVKTDVRNNNGRQKSRQSKQGEVRK